jgi:beta-glucanase (GH16 family)
MKLQIVYSIILFFLCINISCKKEETPCEQKMWYFDADFDGLGDKNNSKEACEAPAGYVANANDDNDNPKSNAVIPTKGYISPNTYAGLKLIWADEFDGTTLDEKNWNYELGNNNGWGNRELQFYRKENTTLRDGYLAIQAKQENFSGFSYTSSRLTTQNKINPKYGRIDVRAVLPKGQGLWPAIWMLGKNINTVNWPKCGEIDIMELIGGGNGKDNKIYGTAHWDNNGSHAQYGGNTTLSANTFNDEFHVFSITWDEKRIIWYLDNVKFHEIDTTPAGLKAFQEEFFLILNVAVGGEWPGNPDGSASFPQYMYVDYVRVFQ